MKRILFFLAALLLLLSPAFSFDIEDSSGKSRTYFSINNYKVNVISDIQYDNFTVYYSLFNGSEQRTYGFNKCSSKYCGNFTLTELIQNLNDTFVGSKIFTISVGNENRTIFFDLENPSFTLISSNVNSQKKQLELEFNYSDNSGLIDSVTLYKEDNDDLLKMANLSGKSRFNYSLSSSENLTLLFKVIDAGGNVFDFEKDFFIDDIFAPNINKSLLIYDKEQYDLYIKVTDENLSKYTITQGSLSLSEDINAKSFEKVVDIPFTSGNVLLRVTDNKGNEVNRTIALSTSGLSVSYNSEYSRDKILRLTSSNANKCVLTKINSDTYNKEFNKDSQQFNVNLDISEQKKYDITFYCENSNLKVYYQRGFTYDTEPPTKPVLSAYANEDGFVDLNWSKSVDSFTTDIEYVLYRDDDEIFDGEERDYEDDEVSYPDEYEYYVEAIDKAGNDVRSDYIKIVPRKVDVRLFSNLGEVQTFKNQNYTFILDTEKNASIVVKHLHNKKVVKEFKLDNLVEERVELGLSFVEGLNEVVVEITDSIGNKKEDTFFVTYEPEVLAANPDDVIGEDVISEPVNQTQSGTVEEETGGWGFWIWILVFLLALGIFIYFFILHEPDRRENNSFSQRGRRKQSRFNLDFGKGKDGMLAKDLQRIKKERIRRQEEAKAEEFRKQALKKKEEERNMSELQRQKKADLEKASRGISERRELTIPFATRTKAKKRVEKIKEEMGEEEYLREERRKQRSKEDKPDPFRDYLNKVKSTSGWDSVRGHVARPEPVEEKPTEVQKPLEKKPEPQKEKIESQKREPQKKDIGLDDYLNRRNKKRRWSSYFVEKDVDRDLKEN